MARQITDKKSTAASRRRPRARPLSTPPACFSVASFCVAHHISEAFYYKLKGQGLGPREMRVGARILISFEDAAAWRVARVAAAATAAE
jgi:hypothetical protein